MLKRVRILLRVSSRQQLEADGDLTVQRALVEEYVKKHEDWKIDYEYFEGDESAYSNTTKSRDILQQIKEDAKKHKFDILVVYKDDRLGRLLWDSSIYVMELKKYGVDVYTVKDGLITPQNDDVMGQLVLALRYGNAQKASADTGMRVKDTAQKLVRKGKFMGGKAPYGYHLELSGEISKHGRALKHLVIDPRQAEIVKKIYNLSYYKEFGSSKIARILNEEDRNMAPRDLWKGGTITSILKNPVYAGYTVYKRREKVNGRYIRLDSKDWIFSEKPDKEIQIIDPEFWNRVQDKRQKRNFRYNTPTLEDVTVIEKNVGELPLIDVIHCGYCGSKLTNGTKYDYWTIKTTGERKCKKRPIYRCQLANNGVPHQSPRLYRAEKIEPIVFEQIANYIGKIQENDNILQHMKNCNMDKVKEKTKEVQIQKKALRKAENELDVMESHVPEAMTGEYIIKLEELVILIRKQKDKIEKIKQCIEIKTDEMEKLRVSSQEVEELQQQIPTWQDVFLNADASTKRVLVNKIIERIDVTKDKITIKFRINLEGKSEPRIMSDSGTILYTHDSK